MVVTATSPPLTAALSHHIKQLSPSSLSTVTAQTTVTIALRLRLWIKVTKDRETNYWGELGKHGVMGARYRLCFKHSSKGKIRD
jgi:hypothetical protein